jgi:hypothetical protein
MNNDPIKIVVGGANPDSIVYIANDQIDGNERVLTLRAKKFGSLYN